MPLNRDAIRYPAKRVLLQRTRLAYVHLRNRLTDAKRDRAARVSGYVAVRMPEELLGIYLEDGSICFHEATHEPLDLMFAGQTGAPDALPAQASPALPWKVSW